MNSVLQKRVIGNEVKSSVKVNIPIVKQQHEE